MATTTSRELPQSTLDVVNTVNIDYMADMIATLRALEDRNQLAWDYGQFDAGRQMRQFVDAMVAVTTPVLRMWEGEMEVST